MDLRHLHPLVAIADRGSLLGAARGPDDRGAGAGRRGPPVADALLAAVAERLAPPGSP